MDLISYDLLYFCNVDGHILKQVGTTGLLQNVLFL